MLPGLPLLVHRTTRGNPHGATRAARYTGFAAATRARVGPFPWAGERGCRATDSRPAAHPNLLILYSVWYKYAA